MALGSAAGAGIAAIRSSPILRRWLPGTVLKIDGWGRIIVTTRLA
jgi:hypothetical protein